MNSSYNTSAEYVSKSDWHVQLGDLLHTLSFLGNSRQLDVVFHVLNNTNPSNNLFIGTVRRDYSLQ